MTHNLTEPVSDLDLWSCDWSRSLQVILSYFDLWSRSIFLQSSPALAVQCTCFFPAYASSDMRAMRAFIGRNLILIQSSELARNNKRFSGNNDICASVLCSEKRTSQSANYNQVDKHWGEGWSAPLCTRKCSSCITIANTTYLLSATGIPKTG